MCLIRRKIAKGKNSFILIGDGPEKCDLEKYVKNKLDNIFPSSDKGYRPDDMSLIIYILALLVQKYMNMKLKINY